MPQEKPHHPIALKTTPYWDARSHIPNGALIAFRNGGVLGWNERTHVTHIATSLWREGDQATLLLAESREGHGGRLVTLSSQVRAYPGAIDVYLPTLGCPLPLQERAATIACNWAGYAYRYRGLLEMGLLEMPLLRWLLRYNPDTTDMTLSAWDAAKVCSQFHIWAYRWAKRELRMEDVDWDPVPGIGDMWVKPGDLVRSGSYHLAFPGLVPRD